MSACGTISRLMKKSLIVSLGVLFLINILNFYDRNVAGALAEPMKKEFDLSDQQIGLLGSAFILFWRPSARICVKPT